MKFEIKTDQNRFLDKFSLPFAISIFTFFFILFSNISININKLTSYYEINYLCRLIIVDKSPSNFKRLSNLTKQSNKQTIWQFCKDFSL
tara:strand:+ start:146 stop:412 length:267 start_codon:yes stop_codon:yes gene_type:complete